MSDEKFTQGEWVASMHRDEVAVYMGEAVNYPYEYYCSDVWYCDSHWCENDETAIANAHLISAAPDMYRALRAIASAHFERKKGNVIIEISQAESDSMIAALQKAEGETTKRGATK